MGGRYTDNGVSSWKLHSRSVLHIGVTFLRCSLLFVCPDANYYVPTGRAICIFSFRAYLYASFSCGFVFLSQIATNIAYCIAHSSRIIVLFVTWSFWWNFCKSCAYGFLYLLSFFSFITVVFISYSLVTLLVKLVFVKQIKSCDVWSTVPVWSLLNQCYGVTAITHATTTTPKARSQLTTRKKCEWQKET